MEAKLSCHRGRAEMAGMVLAAMVPATGETGLVPVFLPDISVKRILRL
jgi:hypothetical protein